MAEYIKREALLAAYDRLHEGPPGGARKLIEEAPAADVAPVRHGRWLDGCDYTAVCPACGKRWDTSSNQTGDFAYCPNCGARMDLGGADNGD